MRVAVIHFYQIHSTVKNLRLDVGFVVLDILYFKSLFLNDRKHLNKSGSNLSILF